MPLCLLEDIQMEVMAIRLFLKLVQNSLIIFEDKAIFSRVSKISRGCKSFDVVKSSHKFFRKTFAISREIFY